MQLRLLPNSPLGWTPYAWLIYLSIYVVYAVVRAGSPADWIIDGAGLLAFLVLYFRGFWVRGQSKLGIAFAIVALGALYSPRNPGANVFFVYGRRSSAGGSACHRRPLAFVIIARGLARPAST